MLFIRICILNSYVNLNQNQSCQFQISSANDKRLLSCQFQSSTVLSTTDSNIPVKFKLLQLCQSNSVHFQIQFVSVIGQVASSHLRTACTYLFDIRRVTSSNTRTACAFYFVFFQPSNQFVSKNSLCFLYLLPAKWPAQIQEQLAPFVVNIPGQVASSHPRTACTCRFATKSP